MRKHILLPLLAILAGCGGLALNLALHRAVDPDTLCYPVDCTHPMMMLALTVAVLVLLGAMLLGGRAPAPFSALTYAPSILPSTLHIAGAFLLLCGGGLMALEAMRRLNAEIPSITGAPILVVGLCALLCLPAGICTLAATKYSLRGAHSDSLPVFMTVTAFAPMPWLLFCYQESVLSPHVALYANQLLAFCCIQLALYFIASAAFESPSPLLIVLTSLMAVYFTLSSLTIGQPMYTSVPLIAFSLIALGNAISVIGTCYPPYHKPPSRVVPEL